MDPLSPSNNPDLIGQGLATLIDEVLHGHALAYDHLARIIDAGLAAPMTDALEHQDVLFDALEIERLILAWGVSPTLTSPSPEGLQRVLAAVVNVGAEGLEGPDSPGELHSLLRRLPLRPGREGLPPLPRPPLPDGTLPHEVRMPWELIDLCELMFQDAIELRLFPPRIDSIQHACAGQEVFISGEHLGSAASVEFTGTDEPVKATVFGGNLIAAVVPAAAQPGPLTITLEREAIRCGRKHVVRLTTTAAFSGGVPAKPIFTIDGEVFDGYATIPPLTTVVVEWTASPHTSNTFRFEPATAVVSTQIGANSGFVAIRTGETNTSVLITVDSVGACRSVTGSLVLDVGVVPELAVVGIEVTQAVQRFDLRGNGPRNTAPLVARRRTAVRAFVEDAGLTPQGTRGIEVAGELTVRSGTRTLGTFPNLASGGGTSSLAYPLSRLDREQEQHGLWFEPPWSTLEGSITFEVRAWPRLLPLTLRRSVKDSASVTFRPVKHLRVGLVPVTHDVIDASGIRSTLPSRKPSVADVSSVFPKAEDAPMFTWLHEFNGGSVQLEVVAPKDGSDQARDAAKTAEMQPIRRLWDRVGEGVKNYTSAPWNFDRVIAVLPSGSPVLQSLTWNDDTNKNEWLELGGWAGPPTILWRFDRVSIAHELLHTLGIGHAAGGGTSGRDPELSGLIGGAVEDVATVVPTRIAASGYYDVMSYTPPSSISITTTEIAINKLERLLP